MSDPFGFLEANIHREVRVRTLHHATLTGTLLSVDDFGNLMLRDWTATGCPPLQSAPSPHIRFVRGSQVKSISVHHAPE